MILYYKAVIMSRIALNENLIAVAKELSVDFFNFSTHIIIDIPSKCKPQENDYVADIEISADGKHLGIITSISKQLLIYELPLAEKHKCFILPRSASRIRFTRDSANILVADKSGDVLIYDVMKTEDMGLKLLGHLSLLLDVLQTNDQKYIITSDRDEKIKVSCYPNTYSIHSYCLGHKEFVNHIELLPHCENYLTSSSGDGTVKIWDFTKGTLCHTINTNQDIENYQHIEHFIKAMDEDGVKVETLPIVHYTITKLDDKKSILAVMVHSLNVLFIYSLQTFGKTFIHKLEHKLTLEQFPDALKFQNASLYVVYQTECSIYDLFLNNDCLTLEHNRKITMFGNKINESDFKIDKYDVIKVLFKRKFDNVLEYQERKKQRLQKSLQ